MRSEHTPPSKYVIFLPLATQEATLTDKEKKTSAETPLCPSNLLVNFQQSCEAAGSNTYSGKMPTVCGDAQLPRMYSLGWGVLMAAGVCRSHGASRSQERASGGYKFPMAQVADCEASNK